MSVATPMIEKYGLQVSTELVNFIEHEVLPELPIQANDYWRSFACLVRDFTPRNNALLAERVSIQATIDNWCAARDAQGDIEDYKDFLKEVGYLVEEREAFVINTQNVDSEISQQAGPQLVVPTSNARFALNATNARWGSLYDALYGTDVISEDNGASRTGAYNSKRGEKVIAYARAFLDKAFPLVEGSHADSTCYSVINGALQVRLSSGNRVGLRECSNLAGYQGSAAAPSSILLRHHGLHVAIEIDPNSPIGKTDPAGVKDLTMEAAVTTIQDFEDSVAAVDAPDKVAVYRNWLGLMKGDLSETFVKNGKQRTRSLVEDKIYTGLDGTEITLHGRSLLFCRNVGHLMSNPAIIDQNGAEIQEGIMDAMISVLIAMHDIRKTEGLRNSRTGSVYIVKPKMHGPAEVAFANDLFDRVEDELGLERHTIKIGIMDEERRTTVNLKECIRQVKDRVVFINTGFLDRTGDEIHTSMLLGAMLSKGDIKQQPWINAYEDWNVDIGIECGFPGKAQIGKGMWAMPDEMAQMMKVKIDHPKSGANTAWVPSPIGATLHAMHYHRANVFDVQKALAARPRASLNDILTIPLADNPNNFTTEQVQAELDNNVQGILGYVVRWIDQGVGCSKVPDISNVGLMEDRATLRISSQHICNWLEHEVCSSEQVTATFKRMAVVVDQQNEKDPDYVPMAPDFNGVAYNAALDLVFAGKTQPSGYTEPLLHDYRLKLKASL